MRRPASAAAAPDEAVTRSASSAFGRACCARSPRSTRRAARRARGERDAPVRPRAGRDRHDAQRAARLGDAAARRHAAAARAARRARRLLPRAAATCRRPLGGLDRRGAVAPLLGWLWLRAARADRRARRPARPVLPDLYPLETAGIVALVSTAIVPRVGVVRRAPADRRAARPPAAAPAAGGLAAATGLVVSVVAAVVWLVNPYAAALLAAGRAPVAVRRRAAVAPARRRGRRCLVALGVALPLLAVAHYVSRSTSTRSTFAWLRRSRPPTGTSRSPRAGRVAVARLPRRTAGRAAGAAQGRGRGRAGAPAHPRAGRLRGARLARRDGVRPAAMRRALRSLSTVLIVAGALLLADAARRCCGRSRCRRSTAQSSRASSTTACRAREGAAGRRRPARAARLDAEPPARVRGALARPPQRRRRPAGPHPDARDRRRRRCSWRARTPATCAAAPATTRPRRCPGSARHRRDRRAPHDLRRAVPRRRRARARRPDRAVRCRTGASPTGSSARGSSRRPPPEVTDRVSYDRLVLSACHPLYCAAQRIIVFARLERAEARGPLHPDNGVSRTQTGCTPHHPSGER